jgi:DNA mismatch endonuclease, patch repair protein
MGFRYRLHAAQLPGKPDLVFARLRKIIEVRGCFWHQHEGCIDSHIPKSRIGYWLPKLKRNRERDAENMRALRLAGYRVLVIWECETRSEVRLASKLKSFLNR